jgi:hypothetical protein
MNEIEDNTPHGIGGWLAFYIAGSILCSAVLLVWTLF